MHRFLNVAAGIATITGLCVATFRLGRSQAVQSVESSKIDINNTIKELNNPFLKYGCHNR
jgi:hypothetical protein